MREALGVEKVKTEANSDRYLNVMILSVNNNRLAFSVDEILEEQEGIVKDLGPMLNQLKKITGVTILANGVIVPVININEIIGKISFNSHYEAGQEREAEAQQENGQKKILVVEDSITVRTMLKTIIENGGYIVKTAFDGQDGLETLLNESFDLLVTDIEMPRMNGFELTEKVRENSAFTDLPIILVTTLDKPEDKRRGLESGANAYIVKGSFEKSNLIETIRRLI
jgi:two-component system chemotaxis sensor kinase CheA